MKGFPMKRIHSVTAIAVGMLSFSSTIPSQAVTGRVYFNCPADGTRVGNADLLVSPPGASWSETAPGSVADGNGCLALDPGSQRGTNQANVYDVLWTGNAETDAQTGLTSMTVEAYATPLGAQAALLASQRLRVRGCIDGSSIGGTEPSAPGIQVNIVPTAINSGATYKFVFTITGLAFPGEYHDVRINIDAWYTDASWIWTWGASEVPAGLTFNPAAPAAVSVAAAAPTTGCGAN